MQTIGMVTGKSKVMKVVVVGGSGFIGSALSLSLIEQGHDVTVLDVRKSERFNDKSVKFIQGSFLDTSSLETLFVNCDVCFHLASTTVPATADKNALDDITQNLYGSVALALRCQEVGVAQFIFMSSGGTIYGDSDGKLLQEDDLKMPRSVYGATKLAVEGYLGALGETKGLDTRIVRLANPYGIGQSPQGIQGLIPVLMRKIAADLDVEIWGNTIRDYIHIDDVVGGLIAVCESSKRNEIYNLGSGVGRSIDTILEFVQDAMGKKGRLTRLPSRPFDVQYNVLDVERIFLETGWKAKVPIESGIEDTWKWVRSILT
jgi:UDP-glucose 4-epimerase